jgi:hypothetical protein
MVPDTGQLPRYPVDDITKPTFCTLQMPFGTAGKKEVAQGVVQPPESGATYNGKPIPPDYALVDVVWVNPDFEHEELNFPTEDENTLIGGDLASRALWNKADIMLEMPTPASHPSYPSSSPPGDDPGDDMTTMAMITTPMGMTMLVAQAAILAIACLPTIAVHMEA